MIISHLTSASIMLLLQNEGNYRITEVNTGSGQNLPKMFLAYYKAQKHHKSINLGQPTKT
jgi:hypothetical protein